MTSRSMPASGCTRRSIAAALSLLLALIASLVLGPPGASAATLTNWRPNAACPDILVLGARGSGQEDGSGGVAADSPTFQLGSEVYGFATHLAARYDDKTVAAWSISYPAVPLSQAVNGNPDIFQAIDQGDTSVRVQVAIVAGQCRSHHTKIVLAGYSQGAAVAREGADFVQDQDSDMIGALVAIADPWNNPNGGGVHLGSADSGNAGLFGAAAAPAYLRSRTAWVCNAGDLVCDSDSVLGAANYALAGGTAVHTTSYQDGNLQAATALFVAAILDTQTGAVISNASCWNSTLAPNDDGSTGQVGIGYTLNFFGESFSHLYVNNNGNVTFDGSLGTYTPFQLNTTNTKIIAPFFADVDTRGAGSDPVTYGYGTTTFQGRPAFCANWLNVGYYGGHTDKLNRFQLLLVDRSDVSAGDFDIVFNYDTINWETGDASSGSGGLGGASARVGYSNGVDRSFELPGSGTNGAFLDANQVTGLAHNSRNSDTLGRYVFPVRSGSVATGHQIAGTVINDSSAPGVPVAGAYVSACSDDGTCALTTTSGSGTYAIGGLPDGHYTVTADPPGAALPGSATVTMAGADVNLDLHVTGPVGPPPGTGIGPNVGGGGLPTLYWGSAATLTTTGCAGATATYAVTIGSSTIASGTMAEGPAGHYAATIAPLYPNHGSAHVQLELTGCASPSHVAFDVYIDPSGTVVDAAGHALSGATVTLLRSNTADGPFAAVDDGSAVMALSNRRNPDTSDADGHFGWDVIPGFYKVRASKDGCHAVGDPGSAFTDSAVLTIPPPATDLTLTLDCAQADTTAPTVVCAAADSQWHAANVVQRCTAADTASGLAHDADSAFDLTTHVSAGDETATATTDSRDVCDQAGNCVTAGPLTGVMVDRKAPQVSCAGADGSWHPADVTIACSAADSGSGLAVAGDASFGLSTHVGVGSETANAVTDTRQVCDSVGNCATAGPVAGNRIDRAAPTLNVPMAIVVDATSPAGASGVAYTTTATDGTDPSPAVACAPASGHAFAIGTTAVSCRATDHAGNVASASFTVHVESAAEQIVDLTNLLRSLFKKPSLSDSLAQSLQSASQSLIQRHPPAACLVMNVFIAAVKLTPNSILTAGQRTLLINEATRIRTVIGC